MGDLGSNLTDIKIHYRQKPYVESIAKDQYCFAEHFEYCDIVDYRNVCNTDDYQKLAKVFACETEMPLVEYLMGLAGESGEAIDILKKHLFQKHELDKRHLAEELGDVAWYLAMAANAIGCDLSDIFCMNIEKLIKRYPKGFDPERSVNRE